MTRRILVHALATTTSITIALSALLSMAGSSPNPVNVQPDKVAIKGYDTVAYFTDGQPTKGSPEFVFAWNGARWQFASAAHRDMFAANPERYAPQFGQFCSMGLALGKRAIADPEVWKIVDGKLYLYFSRGARDKFVHDTNGNMKKAEANYQHHNDLPWAGQK
jgi:hypothetical protein